MYRGPCTVRSLLTFFCCDPTTLRRPCPLCVWEITAYKPHAGTAGAVPSNFVDLIALGESSDYFMLTENIMEDLQYAVNGHAGPGGGDEGEDEFA